MRVRGRVDSHCLSYVIDLMEGVPVPSDALAEQRIALARIFFYTPGTLWTTPTVEAEFARIADPTRRANHQRWTNVLFGVRLPSDPEAVKIRAGELENLHRHEGDRMVLAESEAIGLSVLLSFDKRFVRRLGPHARLPLTTPLSYWNLLAIPRGARPDRSRRTETRSRAGHGGAGDVATRRRRAHASARCVDLVPAQSSLSMARACTCGRSSTAETAQS